ncbi:MAG: hypothetical protein DMG62_24455 [Acidobacteria bacterium]|nr:MAG: hypothetical protein DMG62_24455 [Acidobacteriota bacterium]
MRSPVQQARRGSGIVFLDSSIRVGFLMRGISNKIEHYRDIAHVFSTYELRHKADDAQPFQRGIASFQLFNDGKRWYVITMLWEGETPENPIPAEYLKGK